MDVRYRNMKLRVMDGHSLDTFSNLLSSSAWYLSVVFSFLMEGILSLMAESLLQVCRFYVQLLAFDLWKRMRTVSTEGHTKGSAVRESSEKLGRFSVD